MSWVLPVRWRNRQAQTRSERAVVLSDKKERMEVRALVSYVWGSSQGPHTWDTKIRLAVQTGQRDVPSDLTFFPLIFLFIPLFSFSFLFFPSFIFLSLPPPLLLSSFMAFLPPSLPSFLLSFLPCLSSFFPFLSPSFLLVFKAK